MTEPVLLHCLIDGCKHVWQVYSPEGRVWEMGMHCPGCGHVHISCSHAWAYEEDLLDETIQRVTHDI